MLSGPDHRAVVPAVSVSAGRVHFYERPLSWYIHGPRGGKGRRVALPAADGPKDDPARSSARSRRACLDACGWLWMASRPRYVDTPDGRTVPFRLGLWTLTLPEPMAEGAARRCLSSWFDWARKVARIGSYLWVAELTKRGRVHFHVLLVDWLSQDQAAAAWLRCLHRAGVGLQYQRPPGKLVWVEGCPRSRDAVRYAAKYLGKDFGTRADQLARRYGMAGKPDGAPIDARPEIRARLFEALARPSAVRRRWGASNNLERGGVQVVGVDDPGAWRRLVCELRGLPSVRWGENSDHGQSAWFDLDDVRQERAPVLLGLLRSAV